MTYLQPAVHLHVRTACSIFHPFPSNPRRNIVDNHPTEISSRSLSLFSPSPFFPALSKSLLRLGSPNRRPLPLSAAGLCRCRGQGRTAHRSSAPARRLGAQPLSSSAGSGLGRVGHRRSRRLGLRHGTPVGARSAWCALYPLPLTLSLSRASAVAEGATAVLHRGGQGAPLWRGCRRS